MQLNLGSEVDAGYQKLDFDQPTTIVNLKAVAARRAAMKTGAAKPLPVRRAAMKTGAAKAKTMPMKTSAVTTTAMRMMAKDKGKGKVLEFQQGETNTYKSSSFIAQLSKLLFSVSNHHHVPSNSHFDADPDNNNNNLISVNGDTEIDTMADWFDEEQLDELSHKQLSKYKEAMKIEVCSPSCLSFEF